MFRFVIPVLGGMGFALVAVAALLWTSGSSAGQPPAGTASQNNGAPSRSNKVDMVETASAPTSVPLGTAAATTTVPKPAVAIEPAITAYEQGRDLFVAKGCISCHWHEAAGAPRSGSYSVGPDLTRIESAPYSDLPNSDAFLRKWLKDPKALKPSTLMPNLGLTDGEIESLVAFLMEVEG